MSAENYRLGTPSETVYEVPNSPGDDGKVEIELRYLAVPVGGGESVADPSRTVTFKANPGAKLTIRKVENQVVEVPSERQWLITITLEIRLLRRNGEYDWFWVEQPYTLVKMPEMVDQDVIARAQERGQLIYQQHRLNELFDAARARQLYEQVRIAEWQERQAARRLEYERQQADIQAARQRAIADHNLRVAQTLADAQLDYARRHADWESSESQRVAEAQLVHARAMADWGLAVARARADADLRFTRETADWREAYDRALADARLEFERNHAGWQERTDREYADYLLNVTRSMADIDFQNTSARADYEFQYRRQVADIDLANARATIDAQSQHDAAMARWRLDEQIASADARARYDAQIADLRALEGQVESLARAAYERSAADATYDATVRNAYQQAQFDQATAYATAHNRQASQANTIAGLYNAVASGQSLTQEQQQVLAQHVTDHPELFSPENGLLSSEQLSRAFTDPSVLQSTVTAGGQPVAFMPAQPDGSPTTTQLQTIDLSNPSSMRDLSMLTSALNPVTPESVVRSADFSAESLRNLTPQEVTSRYTFVCTCSDYTERSYNPSTGETRTWTSGAVPTLYGQRVCRHILSTWNQLGIVSQADIPQDVPDA